MSHRSRAASFSWSSAKRDMRNNRQQFPAGFLGARSMVEVYARRRPLITAAGAFDRAAIMAHAVAAAKLHQASRGGTWGEAMSVSLKACWQAAQTARRRAAH